MSKTNDEAEQKRLALLERTRQHALNVHPLLLKGNEGERDAAKKHLMELAERVDMTLDDFLTACGLI